MNNLPCEILAYITKFFDKNSEYKNFSLVCKKFNYVANDKLTYILKYEEFNEVVKNLYNEIIKCSVELFSIAREQVLNDLNNDNNDNNNDDEDDIIFDLNSNSNNSLESEEVIELREKREMLYDKFIENLEKLINLSNQIFIKPIWLIKKIKKYENMELEPGGFYHEDGIDYMVFVNYHLNDLDAKREAKIYYCQKIKYLHTDFYEFLIKEKVY
ncbi:MAG: F-box protein [Candidatus Dojkabacteria bacterium]|nr:F-box protein [Candidatus Dojkabacteria bacterium]